MLRFSRLRLSLFSLVGAVLCFGFLADNADAQLFRRWRAGGSVQSAGVCPNGQCPTVQQSFIQAQPVRQVVRNVASVPLRNAGHWTYPGTIDSHLQSTHGVSTAGMTREQMLNLHDALHEGRAVRQTARPAMQVQAPVLQVVRPAAPARAVSSPSLFGLGDITTLDDKPRPAAAIPEHILAQVDEPEDKPMEVADSFRQTLTKAIVEARKSGKINFREAVMLRVAMRSPAFVQRAQELAVTQVAFSGEESDAIPYDDEGVIQVDGINWEGLAKFLEAFVPLLISLLKAFGL